MKHEYGARPYVVDSSAQQKSVKIDENRNMVYTDDEIDAGLHTVGSNRKHSADRLKAKKEEQARLRQ